MKCKSRTERLAKKGAVETGAKSSLKKAHKPCESEAKKRRTNRELGRG